MFYKTISSKKPKINNVEFGLTDNKGRNVGCIIYVTEQELDVNPNQTSGRFDLDVKESGTHWSVRLQITRDSKPFGAIQGTKICGDFNDIHPHTTKSVLDMKKRQIKKWGK